MPRPNGDEPFEARCMRKKPGSLLCVMPISIVFFRGFDACITSGFRQVGATLPLCYMMVMRGPRSLTEKQAPGTHNDCPAYVIAPPRRLVHNLSRIGLRRRRRQPKESAQIRQSNL